MVPDTCVLIEAERRPKAAFTPGNMLPVAFKMLLVAGNMLLLYS